MTSQPKPPRGARRQELLDKRRERRLKEEHAKEQVRIRDRRQCRVPGCTLLKKGWAPNVAHLDAKGIGGDKQLDRTQVHRMLVLCFPHHQGPMSHHSKDLRIEPETDRGTNGPVHFFVADEQAGWISVGVG